MSMLRTWAVVICNTDDEHSWPSSSALRAPGGSLRIGVVVSLGVMWAALAASYSFGDDGFGWTRFVTATGSIRGGGAMLSSSTQFELKIGNYHQ